MQDPNVYTEDELLKLHIADGSVVLTAGPVKVTIKGPLHPAYVKVLEIHLEAITLMLSKGKGYGTDEDPFQNLRAGKEWGIPDWVGACLRAGDKQQRLKAYAMKGSETTLPDEGPEDNLIDMVNYYCYALLFFREEKSR
jgi:hypothetical protein